MAETCKDKSFVQVQKLSYEDVVTLHMRTHLWPTVACFPLGIACQNKTSWRDNQGLRLYCSDHFSLLTIKPCKLYTGANM
jgi:hypothetical protein